MAAKRVAGKYSLAVAMCFASDSPALQNGGSGNHLKIKRLWPFFSFADGTFGVKKGTMNTNKSGRRYDKQFKQDAVALVQGGREIVEVARDLGVSVWSLRYWVKRAQEGPLTEARTLAQESPEQRELRRLRQENDYLRRQRDILKKALAIVSDQLPASDLR